MGKKTKKDGSKIMRLSPVEQNTVDLIRKMSAAKQFDSNAGDELGISVSMTIVREVCETPGMSGIVARSAGGLVAGALSFHYTMGVLDGLLSALEEQRKWIEGHRINVANAHGISIEDVDRRPTGQASTMEEAMAMVEKSVGIGGPLQ